MPHRSRDSHCWVFQKPQNSNQISLAQPRMTIFGSQGNRPLTHTTSTNAIALHSFPPSHQPSSRNGVQYPMHRLSHDLPSVPRSHPVTSLSTRQACLVRCNLPSCLCMQDPNACPYHSHHRPILTDCQASGGARRRQRSRQPETHMPRRQSDPTPSPRPQRKSITHPHRTSQHQPRRLSDTVTPLLHRPCRVT